jgi:hypothetical protein
VSENIEELGVLGTGMAETVMNVSNAVSQFIVDFQIATKSADKTSRRALFLASAAIVIGVISTLIQIGYSEWRAIRNDEATLVALDAISNRMESIASAQKESSDTFNQSLMTYEQREQSNTQELAATINRLVEVLEKQQSNYKPRLKE